MTYKKLGLTISKGDDVEGKLSRAVTESITNVNQDGSISPKQH